MGGGGVESGQIPYLHSTTPQQQGLAGEPVQEEIPACPAELLAPYNHDVPPPSSEAGRNCPLVTIKELAPTLTKTTPKCCWGRGEPHWTAASLFSAARWSGGMGLGNMGRSDCPCAPAGHQDSCYNSRPGSPVTWGSLSSAPPKQLPSAVEAAGRRALPRTGWQGSEAPWAVLSAV